MARSDRLQRAADNVRVSRRADERAVTENREISDEERLEAFMSTLFQESLPKLPKIPGYHTCWLTTENRVDTIQWRQSIGYELLMQDAFPGLAHLCVKDGQTLANKGFVGHIGVNEMLAAKIKDSLYQKYMTIVHHERPAREQEGIAADIQTSQEGARRVGGRLKVGEGTQELVQDSRPAPHFD
jgi:hypothetical protein